MRTIKEIVFIITPFVVSSAVMYLMGAFLSASWSPDMWERTDRAFCVICAAVFGFMLLIRLQLERKLWDGMYSKTV